MTPSTNKSQLNLPQVIPCAFGNRTPAIPCAPPCGQRIQEPEQGEPQAGTRSSAAQQPRTPRLPRPRSTRSTQPFRLQHQYQIKAEQKFWICSDIFLLLAKTCTEADASKSVICHKVSQATGL